jgi:hypothetical protein
VVKLAKPEHAGALINLHRNLASTKRKTATELHAKPNTNPRTWPPLSQKRIYQVTRAEQMKKYSTASTRLMNGTLIFIFIFAAFRSFRLGSE